MKLYMPLFRSCLTLRNLAQLHGHLLVTGLLKDPLPSTKLIESYAQMGSLQSSRRVFETFLCPDSFMWGVVIKCHLWNHFFEEAVSLYSHMIFQQVHISSFVFPSILRAYSGLGDLGLGRKVHGRVIKCGFDDDLLVETSLLNFYGELGCIDDARKVFDGMSKRDVVSWSCVITSYVENRQAVEGLEMLKRMVSGGIKPDSVTMLAIAEACAQYGHLRLAKSVHGFIIRKEIESDESLNNSLISMYGHCGCLQSAETIFRNIACRETASWTAMISSCNHSGSFAEAVKIFTRMQESTVEPNAVTLLRIINSCARLKWLKAGKSVHCYVLRTVSDPYLGHLGSALVEIYAECQQINYSKSILHSVGIGNVASWNVLISFNVREGSFEDAVLLFAEMLARGLKPDSYSIASSLSACSNQGSLKLGCQIHGHTVKRGFFNEFVQNSLIDLYSKCGFVDLAYTIFDNIKQKSIVTWNCMMCGFSQNGYSAEAIYLFDYMYSNCLEVNEVTFLCAIQACSNSGNLEKGKWIHHMLITHGVHRDLYIDTALIDMYAKSGDLRNARGIFDSMSEKSVVSWTAMIAAYGMHGKINSAISVFNHMVESGVKPNEVTFMNILSACSHAGSVEEGKLYFKMMKYFRINPKTEHFTSVVDLISRSGDLDGAYEMIKAMPLPANSSIWGALLNGCRIHKRISMINNIKRELVQISTDDAGHYSLLSNIYAEVENWDEARRVRSRVEGMGLKRVPGISAI